MSSRRAALGVGILGCWKFLRIRGRDRVGYPNILSLPELKLVIVVLVSVVFLAYSSLECVMSFPKWGGLPEVTSKMGREGFPPLPSMYSSAVDALNKGDSDEYVEKFFVFAKDTSLLMQDTFEGIDNCLNANIAAANPGIYDDLNANFRKEHGKTDEQAVQESDEALRKIADLIPKDSNKTVNQVMQESQEALRKIQSFVSNDDTEAPKDEEDPMTTVFPAWVQPEDDATTWWQPTDNATSDDVTTVFPAVR